MKKFTQKFFLLSMGLMLTMGASAQRPTGAWSTYEDEALTHAQPMVMYKRAADGPIYIIPAWDKRIDATSSGNGFVRVQKKSSDGKGMIVTAMGLSYSNDGNVSANGQFDKKMWVWSEIQQDWIIVDEELGEGALKKTSELEYRDIFNSGAGASEQCVFKDSKTTGGFNNPVKVGRKNPDYTVPSEITWLNAQGGNTATIDEIGKYAYGNATYAQNSINRSIIEKLTISTNIVKIGEYAFRGISTLEEVMIEDGGTLAAIPERCFDACWNLKKVELSSSITSIGGAAFGGCGNLNKMIFKTTTPPTFGKYNNTQDIFTTPLTNYSHSNVDPAQCIIEVPLGAVNSYVASNDGYLATKKFPLCSKFPLETSSGLMTYCSETDFTFKQYNTSSKSWEAGEMKTYYVKGKDVEIENSKVVLTEVTENVMIPGWAEDNDFGVVLKGTSGTTYDIFYPNGRGMTTALTMDDTDNCLKGCVVATPVNATDENNSYFIMSGGVFKRIMKDGQCKANRAYIKISGGPDIDMGTTEESRDLILAFPGETTGITAHEVQGTQNDAWYTLQGILVQQPSKGIFIKNGKKVVIK